jgi:hypothetical protein
MLFLNPLHFFVLGLFQSNQALFDLIDLESVGLVLFGEFEVLALLLDIGFPLHKELPG